MKRKIAAILAADIAGYSRLVAEDEEETLRRLASYRSVTDDFIARYGGRIFNTAGDAVLAEFPSAVEAVRCAIDIQESLRTRNMAYPASRQMNFRIGITIGDVVERDGDLLGDGVNIAARLEGLAEVGGICVSRAVHEQVANKLSVQFADIGAQEVKNIPTPVHAYMVAMRREDGSYSTPQLKKKPAVGRNWMWPAATALVCIVAIGVGGFVYYSTAGKPNAPPAMVTAATTPPESAPAPIPATPPIPVPPALPPPSQLPQSEKFAAEKVPIVSDRTRLTLAREYAPAGDYKAMAMTNSGINAFVVNEPSEESAKAAALEQCQKRVENLQPPRRCELYAVGNTVIYVHRQLPVPPTPWVKHDPLTERSFSASDVPLLREPGRSRIDAVYAAGKRTKAIAIGPGGQFFFLLGQESADEASRRTLEGCGSVAAVPCMVVALDDVFVVAVPTTLKATGFFQAASNTQIAADAKADVARRLADAPAGWSAVAVGINGRPGLALKAQAERDAVNEALADCAKRDSNCRIIAIGPFSVEPN